MARHFTYSLQTGSVALSASATKSMWLLEPGSDPVTVCEFGISFDASAVSTAIRVDLYRATTFGSPAGTSGTLNAWMDKALPSATTAALTALTAEPTTVAIFASWFVQPFGGNLVVQYPLMREPGDSSFSIGLRCVTPSGVTPNCVSYVMLDEG